jgi:flavin reductase (DIM6/NTAB) family NADH-FMN oxidoreductase RutF
MSKRSLGARTLPYPAPVWAIGTYDAAGRPNAATAAWCGICCSRPPCVAVSLRAATYTHGNILARQAFTVSLPSVEQVRLADYLGIASGRNGDKFAQAGLSPVPSELVDAPYVAEFPVVFECRLVHTAELGLHTLFVGEVLDVKVDEDALDENGAPDIAVAEPITFLNGRYYGIGDLLGPAFSIGKSIAERH